MKVLDSTGPSTGPKGSLLVIRHQLDTAHCSGNTTIHSPAVIQLQYSILLESTGTKKSQHFVWFGLRLQMFSDIVISILLHSCKRPRALRYFSQIHHLTFTIEIKKNSFSNKHYYFYTINSSSLLLSSKDLEQKDRDFFLSISSVSKVFCVLIK